MSIQESVYDIIHSDKYRGPQESFREACNRQASTLKDSDSHYEAYRHILSKGMFLPGGRIQASIGSTRITTAYNCFVSSGISDSFVHGHHSIMDVAKEAAATMRLGGGIGYDFCLAPGTLITTINGCVPVEQLTPGDQLVGFPEDFQLQKSLFTPSIVEANTKVMRECYRIETDKGEVIASSDHLFVSRRMARPKKRGQGMQWVKTKDLMEGDLVGFTIKPWNPVDLSDTWLAGMFDGEGWAVRTNVGIAQNDGPVANRIRDELRKLDVSFRECKPGPKLLSFVMKGKWEAFRLLSMLKPTRLTWSVFGKKLSGKSSLPAKVLRITFLGEQEVYATQTSTRTLIANGFLSHNSTLRPSGSLIKKLQSYTSGPIAFMNIFDALCGCVSSAGHRRGAQMGMLRIDHPDIERFIHAKQDTTSLRNFNISVAVTDEFMSCLKSCTPFKLRFEGEVYREVDPLALWEMLMRSTYDWAEPGVAFIDRVNFMNNLWYCEKIFASNPCVPGITPILTKHGYVKIQDVVGKTIEVWNGFEFSTVVPRKTGENQSMVRVLLSDGSELRCTEQHIFVTDKNERIPALLLSKGTKLLKTNWPEIDGRDNDPTLDYYAQGFYSGDGWQKKDGGQYIGLYGSKKGIKHDWKAFSRQAYKISGGYEGTKVGLEKEYLYYPRATFKNKDFVPINHSISSKKSWLAGLLDADGYATKDSCLQLSAKDKSFLQDVKLLLNTLGANGTLSCMKDCFRLSISSWDAWRMQLPLKRLHVTKRGFSKARFLRVVNVFSDGIEAEVFCFTEPKRHMGIFNGVATGQCGEQFLPAYGACLLGSFNLVRFLKFTGTCYEFDWDLFKGTIPHVVRAMDNVIDRTIYPLHEQEQEAKDKRRMGLGVTGLANALEALGYAYGSEGFLEREAKILEQLRDHSYLASVELSKEKGHFKKFDRKKYIEGQFIRTLPEEIQNQIAEHGIRNSHLLSVAPTGTISLAAGNVSSGIEPVMDYEYRRDILTPQGKQTFTLSDYGYREFGITGKRVQDVSVDEHINVLTTAQRFMDSAVSKTCNIPKDYNWEDFKNVYIKAYEGGAKGCTTYRSGGKRESIFSASEGESCTIDEAGRKSCE